jgi:precorrin-6B methylase 2
MTKPESVSLRRKVSRKYKAEGFFKLLCSSVRYIYVSYLRQYLLTGQKQVTYNGIGTMHHTSVFDQIIPGYSVPNDNPDYENAELEAVRKYTQQGDVVVIVGAGLGVTPTVAAQSVGNTGRVTAYEASADRIPQAQKTVDFNQVSKIVKIIHGGVGKLETISGNFGSGSMYAPQQLPDCDYLELDCEGAEELILEEMTIRPDTISVETHETMGGSHSNVMKLLSEKGYEIVGTTDKTAFAEGIRHLVAVKTE